MKVWMTPHYNDTKLNNGVGQVLRNYHKWFPKVGIELVSESDNYDVSASHLGHNQNADVFFCHGFWWGKVDNGKAQQNKALVNCALRSKAVIVPSKYVAMSFRRDFKITPYVIGHGINTNEWRGAKNKGYILWNKNRPSDVCSPDALYELAKRAQDQKFMSTFVPTDKPLLENIEVTGRVPFNKMKQIIKGSSVYFVSAKETFNIGCLEALACGVPVLTFNWGNTPEIITHKKNGYIVNPGDYESLLTGLLWLLEHRSKLSKSCKATAKRYSWLRVSEKIKEIFEDVWRNKIIAMSTM